MGSTATCQAQVIQIEKEKKGNDEVVEKKADELCLKVEKPDGAFNVYKANGKMTKQLYYDIIKFLVPLYNPETEPSILNSLKEAVSKLK